MGSQTNIQIPYAQIVTYVVEKERWHIATKKCYNRALNNVSGMV